MTGSFRLRALVGLRSLGCAMVLMAMLACAEKSADDLVAAGRAAIAKGDHEAAVLHWRSALQREPGRTDLRYELARSLAEVGQLELAIAEFGKLAESPAEAARAVPLLAATLVQAGEYKRLVLSHGKTDLGNPSANAELQTELAAAYMGLRQFDKASSTLKLALRNKPDFAPSLLLAARMVAAEGNFDGARELVRRVLAAQPNDARAWLLSAELSDLVDQDRDAALAAFRKSVALAPRCVDCHSALITHQLRKRDFAAARVDNDALRKVAPGHAFVAMIDGHLALGDGQLERARERAQALLKLFPDHPGVLTLAGVVESRTGLQSQAAAYFGKALAQNPKLDIVRLQLAEAEINLGRPQQALDTLKPLLAPGREMSGALSLAASAQIRLGDVASAERLFQRAARASPNDLRLRASAAAARLDVGDTSAGVSELLDIAGQTRETFAEEALLAALIRRREFTKALEVVDRLAGKAPSDHQWIEMRGRVLAANGDVAAARAAFEQASRAKPDAFSPVGSLAALDMATGQATAARDRVQVFLQQHPRDAGALLVLAEMHASDRQDGWLATKARFDAAIEAAPVARQPRVALVRYLLAQRRPKEALAVAQAATTVFADDPEVTELLARSQMASGELEQALTTFRELAGALRTAPQPYVGLAEVYVLTGKTAQAEVALRQALELDPRFAPAQKAYVELLSMTRRPAEALAHAKALRERRPTDATGYLLEAALLVRSGKPDQAAAVLGLGSEKVRGDELPAQLFSLHLQRQRFDAAAQVGAAQLRRQPDDLNMEFLMSGLDIVRGDLTAAQQRLSRVVSGRPGHALALNNLASVSLKLGRPASDAVGLARRALGLVPTEVAFKDTLARALLAQGQAPEALRLQKEAVEAAPQNHDLRLTLAEIAAKSGDRALASAELARLKALCDGFARQGEVDALLRGL
jgi:cellulose synthase operon protein C